MNFLSFAAVFTDLFLCRMLYQYQCLTCIDVLIKVASVVQRNIKVFLNSIIKSSFYYTVYNRDLSKGEIDSVFKHFIKVSTRKTDYSQNSMQKKWTPQNSILEKQAFH